KNGQFSVVLKDKCLHDESSIEWYDFNRDRVFHVQNSVEFESFNRDRASHVQNSVEYENFNRDRSPLAQKSAISEYFHQGIVSCYLNIIKIFSFRKSGVSLQLFFRI